MSTISPYPLQWPEGRDRIPANKRLRSPFRTSFQRAVENVQRSLRGFQRDAGVKIEHVVLSSNVDLMNDNPADPGAAVWFMMDGQWVAFAVDRFRDVASNVQAIHHIIEARRTELRYGGLEIVRQTFRSFIALPSPAGEKKRTWREILGVGQFPTANEIERLYREKAKTAHPDAGGSDAAMAELNWARKEAMKEMGYV